MDNSGKKDACGMEKKMRDYGKIKMPKYFSTLAWMLLILKMGQYQTVSGFDGVCHQPVVLSCLDI